MDNKKNILTATEKKKRDEFLEMFPDHVFRFIDITGNSRKPELTSDYEKIEEFNSLGYESYFTVNGFANFAKNKSCTLNDLTCINSFFIDIDNRKDQLELDKISAVFAPTYIIETMKGYHLYWLLDETIYKDDYSEEEWEKKKQQWLFIEQELVSWFKADNVVKDLTRILRIPQTKYWKKTDNLYKEGYDKAPFTINIIKKELSKRYSMNQVEEIIALSTPDTTVERSVSNGLSSIASSKNRITGGDIVTISNETANFFQALNSKYPLEERPSFKAILSGDDRTLPPNTSRHGAMIVASALARMAGWSKEETVKHITKTGWHGIVKEKGRGGYEVKKVVEWAYDNNCVFGKNNEIIKHNTTQEEEEALKKAYTEVAKERREQDKIRFSTYEIEILNKYPNLKKNHAGVVFNYSGGVYKMLDRDNLNTLILSSMLEDMLWTYRTSRCVSDKIMCLLSILPTITENEDPDIINVKNGLLNIRTKELLKHTPDFVSFVQFDVDYDPNAKCEVWNKSLQAWTEGQEEELKRNMLQEYAGYCLTRSMKHSKALYLIGDGGNGKSTFADTIGMLVGKDATSNISLEDIYGQFGMAGLIGKRLNIIEEISGNYFHSNKLKALISGEEITVNMKYRDQFKFRTQAKFILAVNEMPRVDDSSSGTERRILAVNFGNNFRSHPDTTLRFSGGKLAHELSGILNWALEGLNRLEKNGKFTETQEQEDIIKGYREDNSTVFAFISEATYPKEATHIYTEVLYKTYRSYVENNGQKPVAYRRFTSEIKRISERDKKFQIIAREKHGGKMKTEGIDIHDHYMVASNINKKTLYQMDNF